MHYHVNKAGRRVKAACTNCKKAKAKCDAQRPCSRCVERGLCECIDAFPRRVGRRRNHFFNKIVTESEVKAVQGERPKPKKPRSRKSRKRSKRDDEKQTPPLPSTGKRFKAQVPLLDLNLNMEGNMAPFKAQIPLLDLNPQRDTKMNSFDMNVFDIPEKFESPRLKVSDASSKYFVPELPGTPKFIFSADSSLPARFGRMRDNFPNVSSQTNQGRLNLDDLSFEKALSQSHSDCGGSACSDKLCRSDGSCSETYGDTCSDLPFTNNIGILDGLETDDPLSGICLDNEVFGIDLPQSASVLY